MIWLLNSDGSISGPGMSADHARTARRGTRAPVVPLFADHAFAARRGRGIPMAHPSLGPCQECGSERLTPLVRSGASAPEAVRCETCGLVLAMDEHARLRAAVEGVPPTLLRVVR